MAGIPLTLAGPGSGMSASRRPRPDGNRLRNTTYGDVNSGSDGGRSPVRVVDEEPRGQRWANPPPRIGRCSRPSRSRPASGSSAAGRGPGRRRRALGGRLPPRHARPGRAGDARRRTVADRRRVPGRDEGEIWLDRTIPTESSPGPPPRDLAPETESDFGPSPMETLEMPATGVHFVVDFARDARRGRPLRARLRGPPRPGGHGAGHDHRRRRRRHGPRRPRPPPRQVGQGLPDHRRLRDPRRAGPGRHGRGVQGPQPRPRPPGGPEGRAGRRRTPARPRSRGSGSSPGRWRTCGIPTSSRSTTSAAATACRTSRWNSSRAAASNRQIRKTPQDPRQAAAWRPGPGAGDAGGPRRGRDPPRPEAGQRPAGRRRPAQDHRLRPGQAAGGRRQPDPHRVDHGHAQLHGPRAGLRPDRRDRPALRPVRPRRDPLRAPDRPAPVPRAPP